MYQSQTQNAASALLLLLAPQTRLPLSVPLLPRLTTQTSHPARASLGQAHSPQQSAPRNPRDRQNSAHSRVFRTAAGIPSESSRNLLPQSLVSRSPPLSLYPHIRALARPWSADRSATRIPAYPIPRATRARHQPCSRPFCVPAPRVPENIADTRHRARPPAAARRPQSSLPRSRSRPCAPQTQSSASFRPACRFPNAAPDSPPHLSSLSFAPTRAADPSPSHALNLRVRSRHMPL